MDPVDWIRHRTHVERANQIDQTETSGREEPGNDKDAADSGTDEEGPIQSVGNEEIESSRVGNKEVLPRHVSKEGGQIREVNANLEAAEHVDSHEAEQKEIDQKEVRVTNKPPDKRDPSFKQLELF